MLLTRNDRKALKLLRETNDSYKAIAKATKISRWRASSICHFFRCRPDTPAKQQARDEWWRQWSGAEEMVRQGRPLDRILEFADQVPIARLWVWCKQYNVPIRYEYAHIYKLTSPSSDVARYIGTTVCLKRRLYEHLHNPINDQMEEWIESLANSFLTPKIHSLEKVPFDDRIKIEANWITKYSIGGMLLNSRQARRKRVTINV